MPGVVGTPAVSKAPGSWGITSVVRECGGWLGAGFTSLCAATWFAVATGAARSHSCFSALLPRSAAIMGGDWIVSHR